jgi:enoyl-CoA hydratase/carnithine racemase
MTYQAISFAIDANIATVTLNRPEILNAFNRVMQTELIDVLDKCDADDAVRAIIVTGAGKAFCAGSDLSAGEKAFDVSQGEDSPIRADSSLDYTKESARDGGGCVSLRIFRCLKPVIAAINGAAVGVGVTMTLPMDVRLASENARIGFVFAKRGMVPEAASSYFLPRVVGISQALEWCFTGKVFSADEARRGGLVKSVLAPQDLLPAARALACQMAENTSPVSIALTRQMLWRGLGMTDPMEAHRVDSRGILHRGRSPDLAEGVRSFFEKRAAAFPGLVSRDMPDYFPWWQEQEYR